MSPGPTPRQVARAQNVERIKRLALDQLAATSASDLSLRAIARELNLVSSAIYRYYPSRDDLITDLIRDAYDELADALASAQETRRAPRRRWTDTCHALRAWAVAEPHRFALIYGSAIPGYVAPADTIAPAGRVVEAFLRTAPEARGSRAPTSRVLDGQLKGMAAAFDLAIGPEVTSAYVGAFARVIGLLTLELNGHFVGGFEPADALFTALVEREADLLGLP